MKILHLCVLATALSIGLLACKKEPKETNQDPLANTDDNFDPSIAGSFSTQTARKFDSTWVSKFFAQYPDFQAYRADLDSFYVKRNFAFAWFDSEGITEQAEHLYNRMTNLQKATGEPDTTLYQSALVQLMSGDFTEENAPLTDLMLTAQYLHYSKRAFSGNISEQQARRLQWMIPREQLPALAMLDKYVNEDKDFLSHEPLRKGYFELKKQLARLKQQGLDTARAIKQDRKTYKPGDSTRTLAEVRQRLILWGDMTDTQGGGQLDASLQQGIQSFQERNGLEPTGLPASSFFKALNVPGQERVKQILVNLERHRWLPRRLEGQHLLVNIPAYTLYAFKGDSLQWTMDVIVGQEARNTVVFNDRLSYLEFAPYWNIPPGILRRDVLPAMRRNANYLASRNMKIVGRIGNTPQIRQEPGGSNPMGKVKFMFPNQYNIYLHDTPNKELFARKVRTLSAGCVRLSDAEKLANHVLSDQPEWTAERINQAMNGSTPQRANMKQRMPVTLTYFTAFTDEKGKLNFREDVYNRDAKLAAVLFK